MSTANTPIGRTKWERCPHCGRKGWYWIRQWNKILYLCKYCDFTRSSVLAVK